MNYCLDCGIKICKHAQKCNTCTRIKQWELGVYKRGEAHRWWKGGTGAYYRKWARRIWEQYSGFPVEEGIYIHHLDGDYTNNDIDNLMPATYKEHEATHANHFSGRKF